jgi:MoxR-like ATPase
MVLATQVPFAGSGTYVLTDVQLDRFGFKINLQYPEDAVELQVLYDIDRIEGNVVKRIVEPADIVELSAVAQGVYVHERVQRYIVDLVLWLRGNPSVLMGPSTRASIWLLKGSRALALVRGRDHVLPDDVKYLALGVVAHRLELSSTARAEDVRVEDLVKSALMAVPVPKI